MTSDLEKKFFDAYGIECNISFHQQFNCAQIPRGLEIYKKREELAKTGRIKIWHKMLNPRPENDCIYWGEYHYPAITDRILLELICIANRFTIIGSGTLDALKEEVMQILIIMQETLPDEKGYLQGLYRRERLEKDQREAYIQVRALFGLESEEQ